MTLVWGLASVFFLRYLDTGHSYRQMIVELKARLPVDYQCISSHNLGEPQRAMLHYFAGILTYRDDQTRSHTRSCDVLLVQGSTRQIYEPDRRWDRIWEGSRPGDKKELYRLYRRLDPVAASPAPVLKASPESYERAADRSGPTRSLANAVVVRGRAFPLKGSRKVTSSFT